MNQSSNFQTYCCVLLAMFACLTILGCECCIPNPKEHPVLMQTLNPGTSPCSFGNDSIYLGVTQVQMNGAALDSSDTLLAYMHGDTLHFVVRERQTDLYFREWVGGIAEDSDGYFMFNDRGGRISGMIGCHGKPYALRQCEDSTAWLAEVDPSKMPNDHLPRSFFIEGPQQIDTCKLMQPMLEIDIDIMCLYTEAALRDAMQEAKLTDRDTLKGRLAMESEISQAVSLANMAFAESDLDVRLNVVYMGKFGTLTWEDGKAFAKLKNDFELSKEVSEVRDLYAADLATLFVASTGQHGRGSIFSSKYPSAGDAFSIVNRISAVNQYSLAHEIGHNLGLKDDCGEESDTLTESGLGYVFTNERGQKVGTIMDRTLGVHRRPIFSSLAKGRGKPAPCGSDEAAVIARNAASVAAYRCRSHVVDSWVGDAFADRGEEPYLAGNDMQVLNSPSIWVRKVEDTNLVHIGIHQNPGSGRNYLYVKLLNGAATPALGELKLYGSPVAINWQPGPRNYLATASSVYLRPNAYKIVKIPFTRGVGQRRHFCYAVTWQPRSELVQPMSGGSLVSYARSSNGVAVKAMNLIQLGLGAVGRKAAGSPTHLDTLSLDIWRIPDSFFAIVFDSDSGGNTFLRAGGEISFRYATDMMDLSPDGVPIDTAKLEPYERPGRTIAVRKSSEFRIPPWIGGNQDEPTRLDIFFKPGTIAVRQDFKLQILYLNGGNLMESLDVVIQVGAPAED